MKLRSITARAAGAGAVTALVAGGLVAATTTAATAATAVSNYTCAMPGVVTFDTAMTVSGDLPVPQYWAGAAVPAGLVNITASATVPAEVAGALGGAGVTGAKSDDYALTLGNGSVPIPLSGSFATNGGNTTWEATGSNLDFMTGDPGVVDGFLPTTFTMNATKADGSTFGAPLTCTLKDPAPGEIVTDFTLLRQSSATVANADKPLTVTKGRKALLPVVVTSTSIGGPVSAGKVVVKEGTKTLGSATLKNGKAKVNLGTKLAVGKHNVLVKYLGIPSVKGSSDKAVVIVKK